MNELFEYWKSTYFSALIASLIMLGGILGGVYRFTFCRVKVIFLIYVTCSFIGIIFFTGFTIFSKTESLQRVTTQESFNTIYEISEFICFSAFFLIIFKNYLLKLITKGALICFLSISCFFLINIFSGNISQPQILKLYSVHSCFY